MKCGAEEKRERQGRPAQHFYDLHRRIELLYVMRGANPHVLTNQSEHAEYVGVQITQV